MRSGLDESSRYLTEARVELLDPARRQQLDSELAAQATEQAVIEFHKYLTFALADGVLTPEEEKSLHRFGAEHGLTPEQIVTYIDAELKDSGAQRVAAVACSAPRPPLRPRKPRRQKSLDPKEDFLRMLRLSGLDSDEMADETRDAFVNMAENLGIDASEAEDLVDLYLEEADKMSDPERCQSAIERSGQARVKLSVVAAATVAPLSMEPEQVRFANYVNSFGSKMLFVPSGEFVMGSEAPDAGPTEKPLTKVTLSRFYMSRHLVTNAEYEQFDPSHIRKRAPGAGDRHPVVYVSSLEAMKYCQSLSTRERKRYRLPTEAEWEYAARGTDGRKYPWGNHEHRGDLANFADRNTVFAWSDREIDDGYPESSPVGRFPVRGEPVRDRGHGGQRLGMVPGLFRGLPRHGQGQSAWAHQRGETGLSWRQLEISL